MRFMQVLVNMHCHPEPDLSHRHPGNAKHYPGPPHASVVLENTALLKIMETGWRSRIFAAQIPG
jgi:hypothetical protein